MTATQLLRQSLFILLAAFSVHAQSEQVIGRQLPLSQTVTGELTQLNQHLYKLPLQQGQFVKITVTTQTFIPILRLTNNEGKKLREAQFVKLPVVGKLYFQIPQTGLYKVTIAPEEDLGESARHYELTAQVTTSPTAEDIAYERGLALIEQYWPLLSRGSPDSLDELLRATDEALNIWRSIGDRPYQAITLYFRAEAYKAKEHFDLALATFHQALSLVREIGVPSRIAGILIPIGQIHAARSEYQEALRYYLEALPLYDPLKHENTIGWNLTNIGHVYTAYGELKKAMDYYQQSYARYDHYKGITREKRTGMGVTLAAIAHLYLALGEKQKALDNLIQAISHFKQAPDPYNEHLSYARMGDVYISLGEYPQAEFYLHKAHRHFQNSHSQAEANVLISLGLFAKAKGDYAQALDAFQTGLRIRRRLSNRRGQAQALTQIGAVHALQNQWDNALHHYAEAQTLWQEIGDKYSEGTTLNYLGIAYAARQSSQQARVYFERSLALRELTNDREGEANTRYQIARLDAANLDYHAARQQMETVLSTVEAVRSTVNNDELRASYLATVKDYYEFYVDLLMHLHRQEPNAGHNRSALKASEMARARSLSEMLTATHRQIRQGIAPALLQQEAELQQRLNAKAIYQRHLIANKAKPELVKAATAEIQTLTIELQTTRTAISTHNPHFAALTQTHAFSLSNLQQTLLDENTLLCVYALGQERSYLWVVSSTGLKSYELPKREQIEGAARRVYELMLPPLQNEAMLKESLSTLGQFIITPAADQLGEKRLLIVPDGALQYIPFAALPTTDQTPLILHNEIIHLPSANALALLRLEIAKRLPAPKTIAVFADPVFTSDDVRLRTTRGKKAYTSPDLEQALRDVGEAGDYLPRLPFTRREADAVSALVKHPNRHTALDFSANRASALNTKLRDFRIIHFATHGILNSTHPELSGLVLSLVDERGRAQNGFLRLHEIYNLSLNAELVVLSACQTGLGKEVRGEGLLGLTRGFMYAGAPRVIASLWKVNDKATAELMQLFYQNLLGTPTRSAAAALRAAQIALLQQPRWSHPSHWAAFTLQGDWK